MPSQSGEYVDPVYGTVQKHPPEPTDLPFGVLIPSMPADGTTPKAITDDLSRLKTKYFNHAVKDAMANATREVEEEGRKDDTGKPPLHLIAPEFLYALAEILDYGAKKYAPRNWERGMAWSRPYAACLRHLLDWWMGKGPDPETGKSHLWHSTACIMFLVTYEIRKAGTDDRPNPEG